jgi:hypothetical protein
MSLSILLSSLLESIRENPDRYDIIFNNNDNDSSTNNNNAQKQDAVLEVSAKLSKVLIDQLVNQTMSALELDTESEDTEERSTAESKAEVADENKNTASTEAVEGEAKDKEEEVKPQEDKADNNNKSTQDTAVDTA